MSMLLSRRFACFCLAASVMPLAAQAQQPSADAPPPPQVVEGGAMSTITIWQTEDGRVEETRSKGGSIRDIAVSRGGSSYNLKPNQAAGSAVPGDAQGSANRGAQWQIFNFDFGRPQERQERVRSADEPLPPPVVR